MNSILKIVLLGNIFGVMVSMSASSLYLGITKYDQCDFQVLFPFSHGLSVYGIFGLMCSLVISVLVLIGTYHKMKDSAAQMEYFQYAFLISIVFAAGTIIWACAIAFIINQVQVQYPTTDLELLCDESILNYSYGFAAVILGLVLLYVAQWIRSAYKKVFNSYKKKLLKTKPKPKPKPKKN